MTTVVLAHGLSVRGDLPLPVQGVSIGAATVLVVTFVGLARFWKEARWEERGEGRPLPAALDRVLTLLVFPARVLGVVLLAAVLVAAAMGPTDPIQNFAPLAIYVGLWVGGLVISAFIGDLWRAFSPFEALAALSEGPGSESSFRPLPDRLGVWPAVVLLLLFTWLELVAPFGPEPRFLSVAVLLYVLAVAGGGMRWGRPWVRAAEAFGALFSVVAAMAPLHRGSDGRLHVRPPLVGLARLVPVPGTAALILVALGSTTFDGLSRLDFYANLAGDSRDLRATLVGTIGLPLTIAVVAALYVWSMRMASREVGVPTRELVDMFAPSLVPIALAYAIAHYFSSLAFEGQQLLIIASDPFNSGWNLFGTAADGINYLLVSTTTIAWVQALSIVVGHVCAVVLAHDRAVARFEPGPALRSQQALLAVMVAYTVGGLLLLLGA